MRSKVCLARVNGARGSDPYLFRRAADKTGDNRESGPQARYVKTMPIDRNLGLVPASWFRVKMCIRYVRPARPARRQSVALNLTRTSSTPNSENSHGD
jgi:hypothetical protein